MNYLEESTKYFAPLDEIVEAIANNEGVNGISNQELANLIDMNKELKSDINKYLLAY